MSETIWKFPIPMADAFELKLPHGARVVHVEAQNGEPCLWARVNPDADRETREFVLAGTGHPLPEGRELEHRGTFQLAPNGIAGSFIGHVLEVVPF